MNNYYQPRRFNMLPEVIKNLLIINGLFFLASLALGQFGFDLIKTLGLYLPGAEQFRPYQVVTHMFMHSNTFFAHIFFNMFVLWMFGTSLENLWGGQRFLIFYLITGLGAALLHLGVNFWQAAQLRAELLSMGYSEYDLDYAIQNTVFDRQELLEYVRLFNTPTVGASGAVYGVLLAYGMIFPNHLIYLYFLVPIRAKYVVLFLGIAELFSGLSSNDDVAHFAHLGGMLFGYVLLRFWKSNGRMNY